MFFEGEDEEWEPRRHCWICTTDSNKFCTLDGNCVSKGAEVCPVCHELVNKDWMCKNPKCEVYVAPPKPVDSSPVSEDDGVWVSRH